MPRQILNDAGIDSGQNRAGDVCAGDRADGSAGTGTGRLERLRTQRSKSFERNVDAVGRRCGRVKRRRIGSSSGDMGMSRMPADDFGAAATSHRRRGDGCAHMGTSATAGQRLPTSARLFRRRRPAKRASDKARSSEISRHGGQIVGFSQGQLKLPDGALVGPTASIGDQQRRRSARRAGTWRAEARNRLRNALTLAAAALMMAWQSSGVTASSGFAPIMGAM